MSIKWSQYVWAESPYSGPAFAVHLALADYANDSGECYPFQESLATKARVSLSSVEKAIKQMCDDGYLERSMKGHQHRYRLLVSNGGPVTGTGGPVPQTGGPVTGTGSNRTVTEPPKNQPHPTPSGPEEEAMPVGSLNDDDEMPEYGQKPERKKERFERAPRSNTHRGSVYEFEREMVKHNCGRDYNLGLLHRTIKNIREDGYTYDEIVLMIKTFFVKYAQDVRAKRKEVDPAQMFASKVGRLKAQMEPTVRGMASGETSVDRSTAAMAVLMKRMGITEESTE